MDIFKEVSNVGFKDHAIAIAKYASTNNERFAILMELFFHKEYRVAQHAAWVVSHCVDSNITLIEPYIEKLINNLHHAQGDAIKRNTLRLLQFIDVPEHLWGKVVDYCFKYLSSNEPVAIKVFAMTVIYNISRHVPEINNELKIIIEDMLPYGTPAIKSRGGKILKKLEKEI